MCVLIRSYLTINKVNNKKYHTVGTVPKSYRETKNTTLSEQFQNPIEKPFKETKQLHNYSLSWLGTDI
jgi:hypothetical protein